MVPDTERGSENVSEQMRKAMSDPIEVILHVIGNAPGEKIFKEKMGENKKEYPLVLLGFNMTLLYSRPHSSYQALYEWYCPIFQKFLVF